MCIQNGSEHRLRRRPRRRRDLRGGRLPRPIGVCIIAENHCIKGLERDTKAEAIKDRRVAIILNIYIYIYIHTYMYDH